MDVTGCLRVPLGSSRVQLHNSLVEDAHAHFQSLVSVVKMATVFEECITEKQGSVVRFLLVGKETQCKGYS
jgi:hypothetical protein